ncbi:MAG: aldehyde ferredoxin oxidoreductase family protein [Deltaproteobacteria bacterium]|nr:aldehyde ferredoxin oxidoreductase family protein [Deltaproteobacteria bacterium]
MEAEIKKIVGAGNRMLEIDLTTQRVKELQITDDDRRLYLGGKGLGLKLLFERLQPGIDPLGEDNYLAFMMGVLMGTGAPCSGRFAALTKSPLTGIMLTSSCGGPFGMAYKTAGYDGLLITGKSAKPIYLEIDSGGVKFQDGAHLWGKDTAETQELLSKNRKDGVLAIGPAGENRVRYANIASGHRFLGRGGMGAVMGAKNLKAIVAHGGTYRILPNDSNKFKALCKKATKYIKANKYTGDYYRNYGTNSNTRPCNEAGLIPVNNFRRGSDARTEDISGQAIQKKYTTRFDTCQPCTILCGHKGTYPDGSEQHIPEYESVNLLGPNLGIFDIDRISEFNDICGKMGMDTISAGATLSWVMEAGGKRLIKTDLKFGSPEGIADQLINIAHRRDQGDELANGTRWLSQKYGGKDFAIHVKGLEMAAYDPRGSWGQGLAYAVANRGACHLSAYLIAHEIYFKLLNPFKTYAKAEFTKLFESAYCGVNSLHTCQFTAYAYTAESPLAKYTPDPVLAVMMQYLPGVATKLVDLSIYSGLFESVSGIPMSPADFLTAGDRIHVLERHMNCREGISRKDDTLPDRLLNESREDDLKKRIVPLEKMLDKYYKLRGYDANGIPTVDTLKKLGIPV